MPKKCLSCRHFVENQITGNFEDAVCLHTETVFNNVIEARNICDREGDGHFVYFEPRDPEAGAAIGYTRAEFEADQLGQTGQDLAAAAGGPR